MTYEGIAAGFVILQVIWLYICWEKGRRAYFWFGLFGVFLPFLWFLPWVGAARLARPSSAWARKFYTPEKMDLAEQRWN